MVVDESMTEIDTKRETDRKQINEDIILNIPEYSDDIYKYLREAEVSICLTLYTILLQCWNYCHGICYVFSVLVE